MEEIENSRKKPRNLREYLKDACETGYVCKWIWKEIINKESRYWAKCIFITLIITTIFGLIQPWLVSYIFNGLVGRNLKILLFGFAGFIICIIGQKITHYHEARSREWFFGINWKNLDNKITELFFEKSMGQHLQEGSALHISNIDRGRMRVFNLVAMLLFEGMSAITTLFIAWTLLWFLSVTAALIMTFNIAVHFLWMFFLNQKVMEACTPTDKEFRKVNRYRMERWEKIERVKTCGKEKEEFEYMDGWFGRVISQDRNFWVWFIGQCTVRESLNAAGMVAIMIYGAWLVWNGSWTLGLLYPLFSWASRVSENIWRMGNLEQQINWNMPSIKSMIDALTMKPDIVVEDVAPAIPRKDKKVNVDFREVSYTYPLGNRENNQDHIKFPIPVLQNIGFSIQQGEKLALIGSSGAGKTTVMRLLLRYMDPDSGAIAVNGRNLCDLNLKSWMEMVGYIPQQTQVFDGTIRDNLIYGLGADEKKLITDNELWEIMRLLQIDFGDRLSHGLETLVGRNGVKLSGGEAQRLMIGSAVVKKPQFMIIDEATSSLDSGTEIEVQRGLAAVLKENISALVVAHRLSTVRFLCNKFIALKSAMNLQNGDSQIDAVAPSFEELYEKSEVFRQLADDQGIIIKS